MALVTAHRLLEFGERTVHGSSCPGLLCVSSPLWLYVLLLLFASKRNSTFIWWGYNGCLDGRRVTDLWIVCTLMLLTD
jgi:hypothetical protein